MLVAESAALLICMTLSVASAATPSTEQLEALRDGADVPNSNLRSVPKRLRVLPLGSTDSASSPCGTMWLVDKNPDDARKGLGAAPYLSSGQVYLIATSAAPCGLSTLRGAGWQRARRSCMRRRAAQGLRAHSSRLAAQFA